MDYYKATRPDGTDFYTGTIKYEVGKRTTHPASKRRTKDDPSTYLSVSTVPTDCTGFKWPCRLFLVRGVGRALTATNLPNKRAFLSVDVVEELPAHMVFGPQGEHVVALIERAARLTSDEAKQLSAAGAATWLTARAAARIAARNAARNAARVAGWYTAGNAAADAALALVVRDLIGSSGFSQTHYDSLTGPWRTVIGKVHPDDAGLPEGKVNDESLLDEGGRLVVEATCEHGALEPHGWVCGEHDTDEKCPRQNCEAYLDFGDHCARLHRDDDACWSASAWWWRIASAGVSERPVMPTEPPNPPTLLDLVTELREAVGLFTGAMPISPKQAWEEAVARVAELRRIAEGGWCYRCEERNREEEELIDPANVDYEAAAKHFCEVTHPEFVKRPCEGHLEWVFDLVGLALGVGEPGQCRSGG